MGRRIRRTARQTIACVLLFLATVAWGVAPAAGALFSVTGANRFGIEPGWLSSYEGSTADPAGISRQITNDLVAPSTTFWGYHIESAAEATIAGLHSRTLGQITQTAPRGGGGQGTVSVNASSLAIGRYDDVVVSGPGGSVTTSVNMSLDGFVSLAAPVLTSLGLTLAQGRAEVSFYVNGAYMGGGFQQNDLHYGAGLATLSVTADGSLSFWHGSGTFTSPAFTVPANVPFQLEVRLATRIYAAGFTGETFDSSAIAWFGDTLTFAPNGAVFNVPVGYSANSADAGIVNNAFTVPEPSSIVMLGLGLIGSLAFVGRRKRQTAR